MQSTQPEVETDVGGDVRIEFVFADTDIEVGGTAKLYAAANGQDICVIGKLIDITD